jgi:cytochrome oxidase Cu insertion factor (SCO1/SenC/PrrC family)
MNAHDPNAVRRGRRQMLVLAALFLVPLAVAFWLYYGSGGWRPSGSTNKGVLLDPPRPLPTAQLPLAGGSPSGDKDVLHDKWTVVYIGDGACDERCRRSLYLSRQTRIALNKDADRVRRVFLVTGTCCDYDYLEQEQQDLIVAIPSGQQGALLLEAFQVQDELPVDAAGRTYLVDPLGNLFMIYPPDAPDKALLTDLRKVLKLSHIG